MKCPKCQTDLIQEDIIIKDELYHEFHCSKCNETYELTSQKLIKEIETLMRKLKEKINKL